MGLHGFEKTEITDHELAKWLRNNGWEGDYENKGNSQTYLAGDGRAIAVLFFNDAELTRTVWLRKEAGDDAKDSVRQ